jgi:uncharacterized protein (DUF58 family)
MAAGYAIGSAPLLAAGAALVLAVVLDGVRLRYVEANRPMPPLVRSVRPNPAFAQSTMGVRLVPVGRANFDDTWPIEETVPTELGRYMTVQPPQRRGAAPVALSYDLTVPHRGRWRLGPTTVTRFSPLGLWWVTVADTGTTQVTVWPAVVDLEVPLLAQDREGLVGQTGVVEPHLDNATVRVYNPGDDLRRVHWRSSARRGELMTRSEEPTDTDHAWIGLHVAPGTAAGPRELAISLAASWILAMDDAGYSVDLACAHQVWHGSADAHLTRLATLTVAEAGQALPPGTPEGIALLVVTRGASRTVSANAVPPPPLGPYATRSAGALAAVVSPVPTDADVVASLGWHPVLINGMDLAAAGRRLGDAIDSWRGAGVR